MHSGEQKGQTKIRVIDRGRQNKKNVIWTVEVENSKK